MADENTPQTQAEHVQETGSLTQVREILLGPVSKDLTDKLADVEQGLDRSMQELRENTSSLIESVESRFAADVTAATEQLTRHEARAEQLEQESRSAIDELQKTVAQSSQEVSRVCDKIRAELAREVAAIREELQQMSQAVAGQLDAHVDRLRHELVDRSSLSAALSEVAVRLSDASMMAPSDPGQPDLDIDRILDGTSPDSASS